MPGDTQHTTIAVGEAPSGRPEIVIRRVIDAPRDLVFKAWSDPAQLDEWFGPDGFRNETHEMDFRPGGAWRFTMHGPDGTDYPNKTVFVEIEPPKRMVYDHGWDREDFEPMFRATVDFIERGDRTEVVLTTVYPSIEARDASVRDVGAIEGGKQTLGRLAAFVEARA